MENSVSSSLSAIESDESLRDGVLFVAKYKFFWITRSQTDVAKNDAKTYSIRLSIFPSDLTGAAVKWDLSGGNQAVARGQRIDHAQRMGALGRDRVAGQDHLQRHGLGQRTRQPVQAAGRRDQAALDLGQAEAGFGHGHMKKNSIHAKKHISCKIWNAFDMKLLI